MTAQKLINVTTGKKINDGKDADGNPICYYCGSDDIVHDASAAWHKETRQWELVATYDSSNCNHCGEEQ